MVGVSYNGRWVRPETIVHTKRMDFLTFIKYNTIRDFHEKIAFSSNISMYIIVKKYLRSYLNTDILTKVKQVKKIV